MTTATAARPNLLAARYAGRCTCGAKFPIGTAIVYRRGAVVGCPACDHGDLSGLSDDALMDHLFGLRSLADRAVAMQSPKTGAALAQLDHVAAEVNRRRALIKAV